MSKKIADFSHHQGTVDFEKAKAELSVAVIRVQYGSSQVDEKYKEYVADCKKHGIPFGHYAYARFVSVSDAVQEAKDFLARADKDAEFLVVDVEEVTTKKASDLVPATQAFIDYLKGQGVEKVGLYTGNSFYHDHGMDKVKADFLWIPRYPVDDKGLLKNAVKPTVKGTHLHQYTQCGKLAGVKGAIDLNQIIGDKDLAYFTGADKKAVVVDPWKKGYLQSGDKGDKVKELQTLLNKEGYKLDVDGIFGSGTEVAVRDFQSKNKLTVDGLAGESTFEKLNEALPSDVYGIVECITAGLKVHVSADLNSKVDRVIGKGDSFKAYGMKNGLYKLGGDVYVTSSSRYVNFTKNPNYKK